MKAWSPQFTLEVIEELRKLPALWDMEMPEYRSLEARSANYEILLQKVHQFDPDATIRDLKNKMKTLRTNIRKMERRVQDYRRCGLEHTPSLYYYDALSFLLPQTRRVGSASNKRKRREGSFEPEDEQISEENKLTLHWNNSGVETCSQSSPRNYSNENSILSQEEENEEIPNDDDMESETCKERTESENNEQVVTDCEVFGQYVAAKLVSISHLQRIYLEKIINDSIYQAELGNLTANTRLCREESYNNVQYTIDMSQRAQYVSEEIQVENTQQNGILVQEIMVNPDQQDENVNTKHIKLERQNSHESWRENQIVPEAGPSTVYTHKVDSEGIAHFVTERIHSEVTSSTLTERIRPLSSGAILMRLDERLQLKAHSDEIAQNIDKHNNSDQNRVIYVDNSKALDEAVLCGRSIVIQNSAYLEPVQRQGVIVEKASVEAGMRYVIREPSGNHVLKNVQFADDDLVKMCEDDGITIICVDTGENGERRGH